MYNENILTASCLNRINKVHRELYGKFRWLISHIQRTPSIDEWPRGYCDFRETFTQIILIIYA